MTAYDIDSLQTIIQRRLGVTELLSVTQLQGGRRLQQDTFRAIVEAKGKTLKAKAKAKPKGKGKGKRKGKAKQGKAESIIADGTFAEEGNEYYFYSVPYPTYDNKASPEWMYERSSGSQCPGLPTGGQDSSSTFTEWDVKLAAFDWDRTACTEHTFRGTYASYCDIAKKVSKDYVATQNAWCSQGKPSAIVTYNDDVVMVGGQRVMGPDMIKKVLDMVLAPGCSDKIKIYAKNERSRSAGKSWHLKSAQKSYSNMGYEVRTEHTLLIDDTKNNIDVAREMACLWCPIYRTVWVNPANGYKTSDNKWHTTSN